MEVRNAITSAQSVESLAKRQRLIGIIHRTCVDHLVLSLEDILMIDVSLDFGASFTLKS